MPEYPPPMVFVPLDMRRVEEGLTHRDDLMLRVDAIIGISFLSPSMARVHLTNGRHFDVHHTTDEIFDKIRGAMAEAMAAEREGT